MECWKRNPRFREVTSLFYSKWPQPRPREKLYVEAIRQIQEEFPGWVPSMRYARVRVVEETFSPSSGIIRTTLERELGATHREILRAIDPEPTGLVRALGPQRRPRLHAREFAFRLQVWDCYLELRSFIKVAIRLKTSEANVRRAFNSAYLDIYGVAPPSRTKVRRTTAFDPAGHVQSCSTCQVARKAEEMCPSARAHLEAAWKGQREVSSAPPKPTPRTSRS